MYASVQDPTNKQTTTSLKGPMWYIAVNKRNKGDTRTQKGDNEKTNETSFSHVKNSRQEKD